MGRKSKAINLVGGTIVYGSFVYVFCVGIFCSKSHYHPSVILETTTAKQKLIKHFRAKTYGNRSASVPGKLMRGDNGERCFRSKSCSPGGA